MTKDLVWRHEKKSPFLFFTSENSDADPIYHFDADPDPNFHEFLFFFQWFYFFCVFNCTETISLMIPNIV